MTESNPRPRKQAAIDYERVRQASRRSRPQRDCDKVPEDWRTAAVDSPAGKKFREELVRRARERAEKRR
jgi:hypothetical protein